MNRRAWTGILLCAVVAGCSESSPAEPLNGSILGFVVDSYLGPLEGVNVAFADGGATATSNQNGTIRFAGVPPGSYNLVAQHSGFVTDVVTVEVTTGKETKTILQLLPVPGDALGREFWHMTGHTDAAMPAQACDECDWGLHARGDSLSLNVTMTWEPLRPSTLQVSIVAADGRVLGEAESSSPLSIVVNEADLAGPAQTLHVRTVFGSDVAPGPFDFEGYAQLDYTTPA